MAASGAVHSVLLADDHPLILNALADLIAAHRDFQVIASVTTGPEALDTLRGRMPAIAVLDVNMPGLSGIEVLQAVTREKVTTKVVFLTAVLSDRETVEAIAAGAAGIVLKQSAPETLIDCMRTVAKGAKWLPAELVNPALRREAERREERQLLEEALTQREIQIVGLAATGMPNKTIARQLNLSEGTVKLHLHNIYSKLGVSNRTQLTALALRLMAGQDGARPRG
jgi:DNA-binding NarL/FixJ family response regulator